MSTTQFEFYQFRNTFINALYDEFGLTDRDAPQPQEDKPETTAVLNETQFLKGIGLEHIDLPAEKILDFYERIENVLNTISFKDKDLDFKRTLAYQVLKSSEMDAFLNEFFGLKNSKNEINRKPNHMRIAFLGLLVIGAAAGPTTLGIMHPQASKEGIKTVGEVLDKNLGPLPIYSIILAAVGIALLAAGAYYYKKHHAGPYEKIAEEDTESKRPALGQ
ncbi:MAG: hypothetical protein QM752_00675 [Gammaproteobacteria bacterium]